MFNLRKMCLFLSILVLSLVTVACGSGGGGGGSGNGGGSGSGGSGGGYGGFLDTGHDKKCYGSDGYSNMLLSDYVNRSYACFALPDNDEVLFLIPNPASNLNISNCSIALSSFDKSVTNDITDIYKTDISGVKSFSTHVILNDLDMHKVEDKILAGQVGFVYVKKASYSLLSHNTGEAVVTCTDVNGASYSSNPSSFYDGLKTVDINF